MYRPGQLLNSSRSWVLMISAFLGAVLLTLLLGFFGYVVLFVFLGLLFYWRKSAVPMPAGLNIENVIDVILAAIIVALFLDIAKVNPFQDVTKHANYSKGAGFTTTTVKQAKDKEQTSSKGLASQEDTNEASTTEGDKLSLPPPGGAIVLPQGTNRATATTYMRKNHTGTSQYVGDRKKPSSRDLTDVKSTIARTSPPTTTTRRSTVTTVVQNPPKERPSPENRSDVTTYEQAPVTSGTTIQEPVVDIETREELEQRTVDTSKQPKIKFGDDDD